MVYSEIAIKDFRLVANVNIGDDQLVSLEKKENNPNLKYGPALDPEVSLYLHEFSKFIEKQYKLRMDIEFVYNQPATIYIVQVRAIPEGNRKGLEPSTLSPVYLEKKDKLQTLNVLQVITPEVNRAALINYSEQVIITQNIEQALSKYNELGQDGRRTVKAVIIQNPAPDTSHEAGVFNAGGIVVMQVKDINTFNNFLLTINEQALIIDPQRCKIYKLPKELETNEKKLYQNEILVKGIYASALSKYVTPINYDFSKIDIKQLSKQPFTSDSKLQLGVLIAKSQNGDKDSFDQLLSTAYSVAAYGHEVKQAEGQRCKTQILHDNIYILATPNIGSRNKDLREALGYNLRVTIAANKKRIINEKIFKQTIIAGCELSLILDKMERQKDHLTTQQKDQIYLEYFNIQKKFSGLNIHSLATSFKDFQYQELAEKLNSEISSKNKEYLIESLKLGDYLINKEQKYNWNKFCVYNCATDNGAKFLGSLVNTLVSYKAHEQWINYIFVEINEPKEPEKTFKNLAEDFKKIDLNKIKIVSNLIKSMDSQISDWFYVNKYERLFKDLQINLKTINENLEWKKDSTNLEKILILTQAHNLVDVMDKTIKSMVRSNLYNDNMQDNKGNNLQVSRFKDMIIQFHNQIMMPWVKNAEFIDNKFRLSCLKKSINEKNCLLLTREELLPSSSFAVCRATIDLPGANDPVPKTLEDIFTLVHQNCLVLLNISSTEFNNIIEKQYPYFIKMFNSEINNIKNSHSLEPSTSVRLQNKELIINKNFPLKNHSATAKIKYFNNDAVVEFKMFGHNEHYRWDYVMLDNYLNLIHDGFEFIIKPYFDKCKNVTSFEVRFSYSRQIKYLVEAINHSIKLSFESDMYYDYNKVRKACIKRLELIEELYKKKPEMRAELEKIRFIPSSFVNFGMLKNVENKSLFLERNHDGLYDCSIMDIDTSNILFNMYNQKLNVPNYFFKNCKDAANLIDADLNIQTLLSYYNKDKNKLDYFMKKSSGLRSLVKSCLSIETINKLYDNRETRVRMMFFIENGVQINTLVKLGLSFDSLRIQKFVKLKYFIDEAFKLEKLAGLDFNIKEFFNLYDTEHSKIKYFIENWASVPHLVQSGLKAKYLFEIYDKDFDMFDYFINNCKKIKELFHYGVKNIFQLYENFNTRTKAKYLIANAWHLINLIKLGVSLETIITLYEQNIDKAKLFIENVDCLDKLDLLGLNPDNLSKLYDKNPTTVKTIISYVDQIRILVKYKFQLENIIELCNDTFESAIIIFKNYSEIVEILNTGVLCVNDLMKHHNPQPIQDLVDGKIEPKKLKKL